MTDEQQAQLAKLNMKRDELQQQLDAIDEKRKELGGDDKSEYDPVKAGKEMAKSDDPNPLAFE